MYYDILDTKLGPLLVAGDDAGLRRVAFQDGTRCLEIPDAWVRDRDAAAGATAQLAAYFAGELRTFDLKLAPQGTSFQRAVWEHLLRIPYGATVSYGHIAGEMGRPSASRAVGAANGRNPIPVIIPCHRVVGASGALTGYAGGVHLKEGLLRIEGVLL